MSYCWAGPDCPTQSPSLLDVQNAETLATLATSGAPQESEDTYTYPKQREPHCVPTLILSSVLMPIALSHRISKKLKWCHRYTHRRPGKAQAATETEGIFALDTVGRTSQVSSADQGRQGSPSLQDGLRPLEGVIHWPLRRTGTGGGGGGGGRE